jgi:phage shock protein C
MPCKDEGMAKLERPRSGEGRLIAGVCAALANRFGISVFLVRLLFVIFAITGAAEIVYIILWIVIPKA